MLCFGLTLVFTMFQFHPFLRNGGILEIEFRIIIPSANISRYLFGFLAFGFYVVPSNKSNGTAFLNPFLFSFPCSSRTSIRFLRRYYFSWYLFFDCTRFQNGNSIFWSCSAYLFLLCTTVIMLELLSLNCTFFKVHALSYFIFRADIVYWSTHLSLMQLIFLCFIVIDCLFPIPERLVIGNLTSMSNYLFVVGHFI